MNSKILALLFAVVFFAGYACAGNIKATSLSYEPAPVSPGSAFTVWVQVKNDSEKSAAFAAMKEAGAIEAARLPLPAEDAAGRPGIR